MAITPSTLGTGRVGITKKTIYYNEDGTYAGYKAERNGHVVAEVRLWESKLAQWFRTFRLNRWGQKRAKRKGYL